jgi:hypothetical protein
MELSYQSLSYSEQINLIAHLELILTNKELYIYTYTQGLTESCGETLGMSST